MKAIPRLIAGTAVVLAAVLTTAPVTAGIADFVLNPGQQPIKRAAPALTGSRTPPVAPIGSRDKDKDRDALGSTESNFDADTGSATTAAAATSASSATTATTATSASSTTTAADAVFSTSAGLVAHTVADAQSRVTDLASDLQSGVDAGEFSQADADRVLGDVSSYIRGERTWPERAVA